MKFWNSLIIVFNVLLLFTVIFQEIRILRVRSERTYYLGRSNDYERAFIKANSKCIYCDSLEKNSVFLYKWKPH